MTSSSACAKPYASFQATKPPGSTATSKACSSWRKRVAASRLAPDGQREQPRMQVLVVERLLDEEVGQRLRAQRRQPVVELAPRRRGCRLAAARRNATARRARPRRSACRTGRRGRPGTYRNRRARRRRARAARGSAVSPARSRGSTPRPTGATRPHPSPRTPRRARTTARPARRRSVSRVSSSVTFGFHPT